MKEKQIEEMSQKLCDKFNEMQGDVSMRELATALYQYGYRYQSVTATEIFSEIEKLHLHITNDFDMRRYNELKKKYTEGRND